MADEADAALIQAAADAMIRRTVVHEAGHAVIAQLDRHDVTDVRVAITVDGHLIGSTSIPRDLPRDDAIRIAVAGFATVGVVVSDDEEAANRADDRADLPDSDDRRIRDAFDKAGTPQRDRKAIVDGIDSDVRKKLVEPAVSEMVNEIAVTIRDVGPAGEKESGDGAASHRAHPRGRHIGICVRRLQAGRRRPPHGRAEPRGDRRPVEPRRRRNRLHAPPSPSSPTATPDWQLNSRSAFDGFGSRWANSHLSSAEPTPFAARYEPRPSQRPSSPSRPQRSSLVTFDVDGAPGPAGRDFAPQ